MKPRETRRVSGEYALFSAGAVLGLCAAIISGCHPRCDDTDCPKPMDLATGVYQVVSEAQFFEETEAPPHLPDLAEAKVEIDAEQKKVILSYTDLLGEPVRVTFQQRADGGGAGEGGS